MLSTSSQAAQAAPVYVAELTESQAFIADIPPLVKKRFFSKKSRVNEYFFFFLGTCCVQ